VKVIDAKPRTCLNSKKRVFAATNAKHKPASTTSFIGGFECGVLLPFYFLQQMDKEFMQSTALIKTSSPDFGLDHDWRRKLHGGQPVSQAYSVGGFSVSRCLLVGHSVRYPGDRHGP